MTQARVFHQLFCGESELPLPQCFQHLFAVGCAGPVGVVDYLLNALIELFGEAGIVALECSQDFSQTDSIASVLL